MEWTALVGEQLPMEFGGNIGIKQHFCMMVEGKFYMPPLSVSYIQNSLFNDIEDKIILFQYGNVADLIPDIIVVYLDSKSFNGRVAELHYDKSTSDMSSFEKKDVVFDPLSKRIVAFSTINP